MSDYEVVKNYFTKGGGRFCFWIASEIAEKFNLDKADVEVQLKKLEREGVIHKRTIYRGEQAYRRTWGYEKK